MKIIAISGWKRSGKDTAAEYLVKNNNYTRVSFADPLKDMAAKEYKIPREHCDSPEHKEAPILHLPVIPKDDFTLNVAKLIYKECRTAEGIQPFDFHQDASGAFLGVINTSSMFTDRETLAQLYWTPRALCILKGSVNRAVRSDFWVQAAIDKIDVIDKVNLDLEGTPGFDPETKIVISDLRYQSEVNQLKQAFGKNLITVRVNRFDTCASSDPSERDLDKAKFDIVIENKGSLEDLYAKINDILK